MRRYARKVILGVPWLPSENATFAKGAIDALSNPGVETGSPFKNLKLAQTTVSLRNFWSWLLSVWEFDNNPNVAVVLTGYSQVPYFSEKTVTRRLTSALDGSRLSRRAGPCLVMTNAANKSPPTGGMSYTYSASPGIVSQKTSSIELIYKP